MQCEDQKIFNASWQLFNIMHERVKRLFFKNNLGLKIDLTLSTSTPQNGQTQSNNLSTFAEKSCEDVRPFFGVALKELREDLFY